MIRKTTSTLITRLFSKTNLKGKNLTFEWQVQKEGPEKVGEKWETKAEIADKKKAAHTARMQEDFRVELFDLNPKPQPPVIEEDELFGTNFPTMKPFNTSHIREVFNIVNYPGKNTLADKKLAYLKELVGKLEVPEAGLQNHLNIIEGKIQAYIAQISGSISLISDSQLNEFYNSPEILPLLEKLALLVQKANQTSFPNLLIILSQKLRYLRDYVPSIPIYKEIERSLFSTMHLYSIQDLSKINFGLTYIMPKRCSTELRTSIRQQVLDASFSSLSIDDVLMVYTAFKQELNCFKVHRKCVAFLIDNYDGIKELCKKSPDLAINIVYTFANCRPGKRFRKKFGLVNNDETDFTYEAGKIEELYMPLVVLSAPKFGSIEIIKFLSASKILNYHDYDEIYFEIEKFLLKNADKLELSELAPILYYTGHTNMRGFGSRTFWKSFVEKFTKFFKLTPEADVHEVTKIVNALASSKAIDTQIFEKVFGKYLLNALNDHSIVFNHHDFSLLATTFMYLDLSTPNKDLMKPYLKALVVRMSFFDEWVPMNYYFYIKMLIYYVSKRFPTWNLEYIINLSYHAEKVLLTERLRHRNLDKEHQTVTSIIQKDLQMGLMSFVDFENLFLIDYAIDEYKFGVVLQTDKESLYQGDNEDRLSSPLFDLKREILALHGWTICTVDYAEFTKLGEKRASWLRDRIKEHYNKALEKGKNLSDEKVKEAMDRLERIVTMDIRDDPSYPAHVRKAEMLQKLKTRSSMKKLT